MKNITIAILTLIIILLMGFYIFDSIRRENNQNTNVPPVVTNDTDNTDGAPQVSLIITNITEGQIVLSNGVVLSISQFPDEVQVSEEASFGSSDRIKEAQISPDQKRIAIAIAGAAHDFAWIYEIDSKKLTPVVFQYGGGVKIGTWKSSTQVTFIVTTPEPSIIEKTIDLNNLDEYPKLK